MGSEYESRGNPFLRPTVLSGDLAGNDDYTATGFLAPNPVYTSMNENSRHILKVDNGDIDPTNSLCEGLILRGGHAQFIDEVDFSEMGGGMLFLNGAPLVRQCRIEFCRSYGIEHRPGCGAGLFSDLGDLTVESSEFLNNHISGGHAAGMCKNAGNLIIANCLFYRNVGFVGTRGGGLRVDQSVDQARIVNTRFIENRAGRRGGGAMVALWNLAPPTSSLACSGGFECVNPVIFSNCAFIANLTTDNFDPPPGGFFSAGGGGVHASRAVEFDHCTFTKNKAKRGAAVATYHQACITLRNSLIWANEYTDTDPSYGLDELDGQLWVCGDDNPQCFITVKSSCLQGLSVATQAYQTECNWSDNIEQDPLFVDGDGPVYDVHLTSGSPCIDIGSTALWQATDDDGDLDRDSDFAEATPLDLDLRRRDKFGTTTQIVDMGAYEFGCLSDYDGSGFVDGVDLALLLGEWTSASYYAPCPTAVEYDLNGDCKINGLDLAIHLAEWDSCGSGDSLGGGGETDAATGSSSAGACGGGYEQFIQWLETDDWDSFLQWYICATVVG